MSSKSKFVTVPGKEIHGVFELQKQRFAVPPNGKPILCDCCGNPMTAVFDVQQLGFWEDHYDTYFVCVDCGKCTLYTYDLSCISIPERAKRRKGAPKSSRIEGR